MGSFEPDNGGVSTEHESGAVRPTSSQRIAVAVCGSAAIVWTAFALYLQLWIVPIGIRGESCPDGASSCRDAAPLGYGVCQAMLCLLAFVLGWRASPTFTSFVVGRPARLALLLPTAAVLASWTALVAVHAAFAGHIY